MDTVFAKQNNEREVKTYHCTKWGMPKLDGHLTVTTERVIFHGAAQKTVTDKNTGEAITRTTDSISEEAELKSISGISTFYGTKVNIIWLLLGLALAIGSIGGTVSCAKIMRTMLVYTSDGMGYAMVMPILLLIVIFFGGVLMFTLLGFGKAFFLNIYSAQSAGAPISIGNAKTANHVLLSMAGHPTPETDIMMKELGALIIDLKADKEEAYKMWAAK